MSTPKIAIIGAGPVGCMLARLLHVSNIPCIIFESDESPNYRSQGGTLDLHTETGLAALRDAGLFDQFLKLARYDGEALLMSDETLKPLAQLEPSGGKDASRFGGQRPEIDRSQLRQLLTESLPEGTIRWGHHLKSVEEDGRLIFAHTIESGYDLIVGADGAWSKVRKVLSDEKPFFSGLSMYELAIPDPENRTPELYKLVNRGSLFAYGPEGRHLAIQQMGSGELNVYAIFKTAEGWLSEQHKSPLDLAQVQERLVGDKGLFAGWHNLTVNGLSKTEGKCYPRALHMLPVGFRWDHVRGFTIIGDAAHIMTPFAGEGVNVGLDDARKLAVAIVGAVKGADSSALADRLDGAVETFENEMGPRVDEYTAQTEAIMKLLFFTPGRDMQSIIDEVMTLHICAHVPQMVRPFVSAGAHAYYFLKRTFW